MQSLNKINNETGKVKGVHIFSICKATDDLAISLQQEIELVRKWREMAIKTGNATEKVLRSLWEQYQFLIHELHKRFLVRQIIVENITTTAGRSVLAQRLAGTNTYTANITHTALGSSATAAAIGNTQLGTEVYRKALSSGTSSSNVAYIETFYTAAETSGTYEEYGNFIDGTGAANSGQLFNRFTQTITKSVTETLNVQSQITINDA